MQAKQTRIGITLRRMLSFDASTNVRYIPYLTGGEGSEGGGGTPTYSIFLRGCSFGALCTVAEARRFSRGIFAARCKSDKRSRSIFFTESYFFF